MKDCMVYSVYNGEAPDGWYGADFHILQWTTEPPTQEGWYWVHHDHDVFVVEVFRAYENKLRVSIVSEETDYELSFFTHWLGPLPAPEPPKIEAIGEWVKRLGKEASKRILSDGKD